MVKGCLILCCCVFVRTEDGYDAEISESCRVREKARGIIHTK